MQCAVQCAVYSAVEIMSCITPGKGHLIRQNWNSDIADKSDINDVVGKSDINNVVDKSDISNVADKSDINDVIGKKDINDVVNKSDINDVADKSDISDDVGERSTFFHSVKLLYSSVLRNSSFMETTN